MFRAGMILAILLTSLVLGLGSMFRLVESGVDIGALRSGPWSANVRAANDPDPYTRAHLAKSGEVALALAEGIRLRAVSDDDGRSLTGRCRYSISGNTPQARFWTLTVTSRSGEFFENALNRNGFTASELLRGAKGDWSILLSSSVEPGNWLPLATGQDFALVLHLYEPAILGGTSSIERERLPHIHRESCA